ncbi:hypothetical protein GCM10020255_099350 [Rhodococcus baikonurensis]
MATTMFHWGLHPWAMYAVVGLAIAYGSYRRGRKQLFSSAFIPLLGRKAEGPIGKVIDILAIFATLFGTAASLGLGALQIGSGFEVVGWMEEAGVFLLVAIVAVLTLAFVASAVSGVAKGIQWLSNINMVLALILALFVFVLGPTVLILNLLPTTIGAYVSDLAQMSARTGASSNPETGAWLSSWTIFYWAWWVSWTPFVGMFLARISRGRTIRQFIVGVIAVPTTVSLLWFAIFGGAGIGEERDGIGLSGRGSEEAQLFGMLDNLPLAGVTTVLVMLLVAVFFVSGADAASMVMGTLTTRNARTESLGRGLLGHVDRWRRSTSALDRWFRSARRLADDDDHRGGTVRAGHDRPVLLAVQGSSHDPIIVAAKEQKRALLRPRRGRRVGKPAE